MSFRNAKTLLLVCSTLFALAALPMSGLAQYSSPGGGVDDSNAVFQLEGNTTTDPYICFGINTAGPVIATPGTSKSCPSGTNLVQFGTQTEDWANISSNTTVSAASTGIGSDLFNSLNDDIYTGGSTKDTSDFSGWLWKFGKPQSKDDFEHAYAAAYSRSDSHVIIVAGVDRYDNSGSSTAGFWFVQDPTTGSGTTGTPCVAINSSGCPFGGTHKDGDFLIISQFTVGGAVSTIQVFVWEGGAITGPFTTIGSNPSLSAGQCDPRTGNLGLCGTVNGVPVLAGGWSFSAKHSTGCEGSGTGAGTTKANCMDVGEFLEVGLDLTGLFQSLGKPLPCISTFFAESRSSGTGITSTLSDFVGPLGFPLCGLSDTKTCTGASILSDGATVQYGFSGTISNTGIGTLTGASIADTPNTDGTGVTNLVLCEPAASPACTSNSVTTQTLTAKGTAGSSVTYNGSFETQSPSSTLPNDALASGTTPEGVVLTHHASWIVAPATKLPSNCIPAPTGTLVLSKSCFVTGIDSSLGIHVHFTGSVTNNASVQVSSIAVTDAPEGESGTAVTLSATTLAPGGVATFSGDYLAVTCTPINSTGNGVTIEDLGRCVFKDTVTATGVGALGYSLPAVLPDTANCNLCPGATDATGNSFCSGN